VDLTTLIGIVTGVGCIYFGHALGDALPATASAALIVMGGTLGAVVTQFPVRDLFGALSEVRRAFTGGVGPLDPVVKQLVECARLVRREGLLAVEKVAEAEPDSFLKQAFLAMADGHDTAVLREQLNAAIDQGERMRQTGPRFFEAAGGYAPTIGILGAVLGLIQVMQRLGEGGEAADEDSKRIETP
jgi:chemotaxis protein MotA